MSHNTRYFILILFITAIIFSSGCIVPTKDQPPPAETQSGGVNYLVPGTGGTSPQKNPEGTQITAATDQKPTATPMPDDTRYLTPVPTYAVISDSGPTYRNLSFLAEQTIVIPDYQEIYNNELSLKDYTVAYAYDLKAPPMIISFDIKPRVDSRTIWYESRTGSYDSEGNRDDVFITTPQLSPNAWFQVIVRDKATGKIVLEDGFGRTYGGGTQRNVSVRSSGDYQIDMSGNEVNVTVKMYIVKGTT